MIAEGPGLGIYMRAQLIMYRSQRPLVEERTYDREELRLLKTSLLVEPSILFLCREEPEVRDDDSVEISDECYSKIREFLPPHYTYNPERLGGRLEGMISLLRREVEVAKLLGWRAYHERLVSLARRVGEEAKIRVEYAMLGEEYGEKIEEAEELLSGLMKVRDQKNEEGRL